MKGRAFVAVVDGLSRAAAVLAGLLLIAAMVVVCEMIVLRYVFRASTIWQTDFAVYSATASVFLGAPYVLMTKGHVGVDFVENAVSPAVQRRLSAIGAGFGLLFCVLMAAASFSYFLEALEGGWRTPGVWKIPQWIPLLPMPVGFGLLVLQYGAEFLRPAPAGEPS